MQNNGTKFKVIFLGVCMLLALFGLFALISYKSKKTNTTATVPITVWGTISAGPINVLLQKFANEQKNDLKISYVQMKPETIYNDAIEAIASGNSPDVVLIPQDLIRTFYTKINIIPFTMFSETDFRNNFVQGAEVFLSGGVMAVPFAVDPLMMYWNRDMFANAGIAKAPETWDAFPTLVEKLTKVENNSDIKQSAVSFGEYANVDNAKALLSTLFFQTGNPIVTSSSNGYVSTLNTYPSLFEPLNAFTEYSNPKKTVYSWNSTMPNSRKAFLSEQLAIYFGFSSEKNNLRISNPNLNFDVAFMPQALGTKNKMTFGNIYGFVFLKSSLKFSIALSRIFQLITPDAIKNFTDLSDFAPVRRDVIGFGPTDSSRKIFYDSALIAKSFWDPSPASSDAVFKDLVEDVSSGRLNVNKSLEKANNALNNLL